MSGHTPGPWFYRTCGASREHVWTVLQGAEGDGLNKVIADVCDRGIHHEEGEANARLITAAPELLEVAEAAFKALCEHAPGLDHLVDRLEAVIAKATGAA